VSIWGLPDQIVPAVEEFFAATGTAPADYVKFVVPQTTGIRALMIMGKCGLDMMRVLPYLLTQRIGNAGAIQSFIALANILDLAELGELVGSSTPGKGRPAARPGTRSRAVAATSWFPLASSARTTTATSWGSRIFIT
jgi:hypothetical protein